MKRLREAFRETDERVPIHDRETHWGKQRSQKEILRNKEKGADQPGKHGEGSKEETPNDLVNGLCEYSWGNRKEK